MRELVRADPSGSHLLIEGDGLDGHGVLGATPDEGVPEEDPWFVHSVEQLAGIVQVAQVDQGYEEAREEAVFDGEAGGEEDGVDLFELVPAAGARPEQGGGALFGR